MKLVKRNYGAPKYEIKEAVKEAIVNAWWHGHKKDTRTIEIDIYFGKKGYVFSITDQGEGFDFEETIRKFNAKEEYATRNGGGIKAYSSPGFITYFSNEGRTTNIRPTIEAE